MNFPNIIVLILFIIFPLALAALLPPIQIEKLKIPANSTLKSTLIIAGTLLLASILLYAGYFISPIFSGLKFTAAFLPFLAFMWGLALRTAVRWPHLKKEEILLDLGRVESNLHLFLGIFFFLFSWFLPVVISFMYEIFSIEMYFLFFIVVIMQNTTALMNLVIYFSKTRITKDGILRLGYLGTLKWEDIQSYRWGRAGSQDVPLTIKAKYEFSLPIPLEYQRQLNQILQTQKIPRLPSYPGSLIVEPLFEQ